MQASPKPVVTSVSPAVVDPGDSVTIAGSNFRPGNRQTWVAINSTRAVVTAMTATSITATVPDYVTTGHVTVGTPFGRATSTDDLVVAPAPILTSEIASTTRTTVGATTTATVGTAGKVALLVFDGHAGQRVTITSTANSFSYVYLSLLRPDGHVIIDRAGSSSDRFLDTVTLDDDGTYTVVVDPETTATGSVDVRVRDVPPDVTGPLTLGGPAKAVNITTPGQNAALTFTGTAGQRVTLTATSTTMNDYVDYEIDAPNGTRVYGSYVGVGSRNWSDAVTLPSAGTYTVKINPENQGVGVVSFQLAGVPPDITGTLTVGGATKAVTIPTAGQNAVLTFTGTAGQRVALTATSTTMNDYEDFEIRTPGGALVYASYVGVGSSTWSDRLVLPTAGTYTLKINPEDEGVGTVTYKLATVPADVTGTMTVGGPAKAVNITAPGQNASADLRGHGGAAGRAHRDQHHDERLRRLRAQGPRRRPGARLVRRSRGARRPHPR